MHISPCVESRCVLRALAGMQLSGVLSSVLSHGSVVGGGLQAVPLLSFSPLPHRSLSQVSHFQIPLPDTYAYLPFPVALICLAAVVVRTCAYTCERAHICAHKHAILGCIRVLWYMLGYIPDVLCLVGYIPVQWHIPVLKYTPVLAQRESTAGLSNSIYLFICLNDVDICAIEVYYYYY